MRVLFFSTVFPQPHDPRRGPYNLHRCRALAANHDVAVISPWRWTERVAARAIDRRASAEFAREFVTVDYPTFVYLPGLLYAQHARLLWWSCRRTVEAFVSRFRPDVVLSYWTYPDSAVARRIARAVGVPSVAIVGGSDVLLADRPARRLRLARVLSEADAVMAVSDDLCLRIRELGIESSRIHLLPPAVDRATFRPGDRGRARGRLGLPQSVPILLWVGRMVPVKGLATLLDACAALKREGREFLLCLVGDGPLASSLRERAAAHGLDDRVRFAGERREDELPDWYRAADVTVCPSVSEGTPNVLLESIACGTRFVASRVGGIPSLASPTLDALVPAGDVAALTSALRTTMTEAPTDAARSFVPGSWTAVAAVIEQVLAHAIAAQRRHAPGVALGLLGWNL
jgi:glycosyltransferase involved in cell wall biosynthesis